MQRMTAGTERQGRSGPGAANEIYLGGVKYPSKRRPFSVYRRRQARLMMAAAAAPESRKAFIRNNWLAPHGYVSSGRTRRNRRHAVCVDLRGLHDHDEDH